jgi:hypothetical protein
MAEESEWGSDIAKSNTQAKDYAPRLLALPEFDRVAANGAIRAVGRLHGAHEDIPNTYWLSASLEPFSAFDTWASPKTQPKDVGIPEYRDVKINREDVYKAWPKKISTPSPVGTPRLCVDCKYFGLVSCRHANALDVVTGQQFSLKDVRADPNLCGQEGKWFERRDRS